MVSEGDVVPDASRKASRAVYVPTFAYACCTRAGVASAPRSVVTPSPKSSAAVRGAVPGSAVKVTVSPTITDEQSARPSAQESCGAAADAVVLGATGLALPHAATANAAMSAIQT